MDSCSQGGRSSFATAVFFFARPRAGRGEEAVGWGAAEAECRGIALGLGVAGGGAAGDAEDVEVEDELAICCNFASLFKRI